MRVLFYTLCCVALVRARHLPHLKATQIQTRVIGGTRAQIGQVAYQVCVCHCFFVPMCVHSHCFKVSLQEEGRHFCGGAIVHSNWILSAAHCFDDKSIHYDDNLARLSVRYGTVLNDDGGRVVQIKRVILHPLYSATSYPPNDDIVLIETATPLEFDSTIANSIRLPTPDMDDIPSSGSVVVSGWGDIGEGATNEFSSVSQLRVVQVPIIRREDCYPGVLLRNMFCAGKRGKDACAGDSGGPAVQHDTLVGIISAGYGCGAGYPGLYTSVAKYRPWIEHIIATESVQSWQVPTINEWILWFEYAISFIVAVGILKAVWMFRRWRQRTSKKSTFDPDYSSHNMI